ncbi:Crp/Fnr family transcriptional regulator [Paenibacillus glucanolyticus]|uniref:Crp/Fnr family transcriptional regulator n=1 Tax=Paenibacillus glucanolyticus TaxID=59843 RepID=UPI00096D919B|nr:cyclic nucleotide-binding domain-containing protein [Paenibacillus glucanolyticus]OMF80237.1 Crp/Fnr family transcriptional regulator [Paenibacillus glucanolyticus]
MKEIHNAELLRNFLLNHEMESVFHEELIPYLVLYRFDQGDIICTQGEPAEMLYILVQGKIKIYTTSAEGKALVLSFKTPLEVIGDIEYIQGNPMINTVQAVSPVYMIGVHYRWLRKYGQEHSPLLQFLLRIITRKFYIKSNFLSFNLLHPVEVRLASYLLSVSVEDSDTLKTDDPTAFNLTDIANLLGTSYRHLNRVILKFSQEGLIERRKGFILIKNREALTIVAGGNIYEE